MTDQVQQAERVKNGTAAPVGRAGAKTILWGVLIPAAIALSAVKLIGSIQADSPETRLEKALTAGNYKAASSLYQELITENFFNIAYHRGYLLAVAQMPESTHQAAIWKYRTYAASKDPATADIGWYGLGLEASRQGNWPAALAAFENVTDRDMPFLNNSLGYINLQLADCKRAETAFLREIDLDGNTEGAYHNLARLYHVQGNLDALKDMLTNPRAAVNMPRHIWRQTVLKAGYVGIYLIELLRIDYGTVWGLAASAMGMMLWFGYLRRLDVFEPEPLKALLLTLGLAMAFSTLGVVWYDIFDVVLGLRLGDGLGRDFIFCIAGIGLIEETLKIIPFLLMLRFSRQVNESLDYIIYASTAALGFAFMENLLYFQDAGLVSIVSRTFSAVLMHISLTTFAAFGLFYAKYKKHGRNRWIYFALFFAAAVVTHGLYDFWLLADGLAKPYTLLSLVILIVCVQVFSKMVKNGLNHSEFNTDARRRIEHHTQYLVCFLSAVFLLQYVLVALRCGPENANLGLVQSAAFLYIPLLVVFGNMGTLEIQKDRWVPLFGRPAKP